MFRFYKEDEKEIEDSLISIKKEMAVVRKNMHLLNGLVKLFSKEVLYKISWIRELRKKF